MMVLSKEQILGADDLRRETVAVPEWGGEVIVRGLTGEERDGFEQGFVDGEGKRNLANLRARLVALSVVDEQGNRLFTADDAAELGRKSGAAIDRVFAIAQRLSGLGGKDVETLAKN